jgi:hypothetical protein
MDKTTKAMILLIGVGVLFSVFKERFSSKKKQEIIVGRHHVDKGPCISAMNELLGQGIDSSQMCDCLIPKFYELIKDDPSKTKKFEETGFFKLQGPLNDSATLLFGNCVLQSIIDTTFKLDLENFKEPFLKKLKDTLAFYTEFQSYNIDSLANCFFQNLNGKVTIYEYFNDGYMKVDKIRSVITNCLVKNTSK